MEGYARSSIAVMLLLAASPAPAKTWQIRMLNKGSQGAMVFEPGFLKIAPGDSVVFVPSDPSHSAESIPSMLPAGAAAFRGRIDQAITVPFPTPGLYGYRCAPHFAMGMVGLIQVGAGGDSRAAAATAATFPSFARARMLGALQNVR